MAYCLQRETHANILKRKVTVTTLQSITTSLRFNAFNNIKLCKLKDWCLKIQILYLTSCETLSKLLKPLCASLKQTNTTLSCED